ncbi:MAG: PFL family protein [Clostridia bacterium]|nr:PFL family protein [Clostridia bacterium]
MISKFDILDTVNMIRSQHLDVRCITMGLSLFDCIDPDAKRCAAKVYDKIVYCAKDLVKVGNEIAEIYGIPVVNKRVSVTPVSLVGQASGGYLELAAALDRAAQETGVDFIGGYTALVQKGMSEGECAFLDTIPEALASTQKLCSSVNVASTRAGVNMDAIYKMGQAVKKAAYLTRDQGSIACAKLVVFANAVDDNPFMAGAFNGMGEGDKVINVGVSGPGVIKAALESVNGDLTEVAECIKRTAFKVTRVGQLVAKEAAERLGANFGIVDLSLAPTPAVGDSVAWILEEMGLERVGCHGTTAALALLNDAIKKGGVMASSHVGGLSGAFIPVSEDIGMINSAAAGGITLDKLEAMTAVCSVGIDMVAIPGDTTAETISAIIADEIAIGVVNNKTTAVRVIPVEGAKAGDMVEFGGLLGRAPVMKVNAGSAAKFVQRGGRVPAPIHSNKN